jgi:hypothetical protein
VNSFEVLTPIALQGKSVYFVISYTQNACKMGSRMRLETQRLVFTE